MFIICNSIITAIFGKNIKKILKKNVINIKKLIEPIDGC